MKKIRLTEDGYRDLLQEQQLLLNNRKSAVSELQRAREMGDLSENAAYRVGRSKLSRIDSRLRYLEKVLKKSTIVEPNKSGYIDIGSSVIINDGQKDKSLLLVDGYESDILKGKISVYSPIGKALRGKRKGDKIRVEIPQGVQEYTITSA